MRMVYTDSVIAFTESKVLGHHVENQDILSFDIIPLFQVDAIMVLNGDLAEVDSKEVKESSDDVALDNPVPVDSLKGNSSNKLEKSNSRIGKPKRQDSGVDPAGNKSVLSTSKVRNAIKISTAIDGYNSGRAYIIQTHECLRLASELSTCAQVARERHNLRSKWRKVQDKMRGIYSSNAVQGFVGLLIIVVRPSSAISIFDTSAQHYHPLAHPRSRAELIRAHRGRTSRSASRSRSSTPACRTTAATPPSSPASSTSRTTSSSPSSPSSSPSTWRATSGAASSATRGAGSTSSSSACPSCPSGPYPYPAASSACSGPSESSGTPDRPRDAYAGNRSLKVVGGWAEGCGRLFGKIKAVKQIITALTKSLIPVMNAFILMFIVVCICERARYLTRFTGQLQSLICILVCVGVGG